MRKVWGESWPGRNLERGGEELGEEHGEDHGPDQWDRTEGQPDIHLAQPALIKPAEQSESVIIISGNYIFN